MSPEELHYEELLSTYANGNPAAYSKLKEGNDLDFKTAQAAYHARHGRVISLALASDLHHKLHTWNLFIICPFDELFDKTVFKVVGYDETERSFLLTIAIDFGAGLTSRQFDELGHRELQKIMEMDINTLHHYLNENKRYLRVDCELKAVHELPQNHATTPV